MSEQSTATPESTGADQVGGATDVDSTAEHPAVPGSEDADAAAEGKGKGGRKPMRRATKIRLSVIGGVALIVAIIFIGYYVLYARSYVSTDNAQIDGNQISVNAPTSGTLIDWKATQGTQITANEPIGRIAIQDGYNQPQYVVRAPADGTIAVNNAITGSFVAAGTPLAIAYDGSGVFVTARVDETSINDVHVGEPVKISVDAFPKAHLTGQVAEIKIGAAGVFSPFGQSNTTGNFQKVTQVIPVKITIDDLQGLALAPGMNVTVHIHRG